MSQNRGKSFTWIVEFIDDLYNAIHQIHLEIYHKPILVYYFRPVKWYLTMNVVFTRQNPDGGTDRTSPHFQSRPVVQLNHINTMDHIEEAITRLNTLVEIYTDHGSSWIIEEIRNVSLNLAAYDNIGGSSYNKSPKWLDNKESTVNIKNYDEMCFVYCALAVSHPQKAHPNRVTHYERYVRELNLSGLKFSIGIDQIPLFEKNNTDYAVTVMSIRTDHVWMFEAYTPLYASMHRDRKYVVKLLLLSNEDVEEDVGDRRHYVLIRDLGALLWSSTNHHDKIFPCPFCLYRFTVEATLEKHIPDCGKHGVQRVSYPSPGSNILQFTNLANQMKVPFAIFADFENFLEKDEIEAGKTRKLIDRHVPSGFCCLTVSSFPEYNNEEPWVCSDGDIMDSFFSYLNLEHVRINNIVQRRANDPTE